ncbi:hypothetical protein AB9B48_15515, partial [Kluyvera ascorbata]|uniref:hypothetical protein n=1 Tax=Kluyvera ascorbata TaxID=51288 RepID=UPI00350EDF2C
IATSWFPPLIPSGCGAGVSSHPCEPRPQPTSLWADPAYGKRFGDLDATNTRAVFQLTAKNNTNVTETDESPLEIGEP